MALRGLDDSSGRTIFWTRRQVLTQHNRREIGSRLSDSVHSRALLQHLRGARVSHVFFFLLESRKRRIGRAINGNRSPISRPSSSPVLHLRIRRYRGYLERIRSNRTAPSGYAIRRPSFMGSARAAFPPRSHAARTWLACSAAPVPRFGSRHATSERTSTAFTWPSNVG